MVKRWGIRKGGRPIKCSLCGIPSGSRVASFTRGHTEGITLRKVGYRIEQGHAVFLYRCQNCYVGY